MPNRFSLQRPRQSRNRLQGISSILFSKTANVGVTTNKHGEKVSLLMWLIIRACLRYSMNIVFRPISSRHQKCRSFKTKVLTRWNVSAFIWNQGSTDQKQSVLGPGWPDGGPWITFCKNATSKTTDGWSPLDPSGPSSKTNFHHERKITRIQWKANSPPYLNNVTEFTLNITRQAIYWSYYCRNKFITRPYIPGRKNNPVHTGCTKSRVWTADGP